MRGTVGRRVVLSALAAAGLTGRASAADAAVSIDNFTFSPAWLAVPPGTRVVWTNHDDIPHTIADSEHPKEMRSPALDTDEAYARVFPVAGTYRYFCSLHPHMQGTIEVR